MNVEQALALLDQAVSRISGTRQDHDLLREAMRVVAEAALPKIPAAPRPAGKKE